MSSNSLALLACGQPIYNVPPLVNVALALQEAGFMVLVVGYHRDGLPAIEKLAPRVRILRLRLRSRLIPFGPLRKLLAPAEFLAGCRSVIRKAKPDALLAFNDLATPLLKTAGPECRTVAWLLEYPEFERMNPLSRAALSWWVRFWASGEAVVTPTNQRMALHCGHRPELLALATFIVANSPRFAAISSSSLSTNGQEAATWLAAARARGLITAVHAGAIGDRYGIGAAIQGVAAVPEAGLLILGPDHPVAAADVRRALEACGGCNRVKWVREVPYRELPTILQDADVGFVHYVGDCLNTRFSAPGKLYEYLRAGLAVLTDSESCETAALAAADCVAFFPRPATSQSVGAAVELLVRRRHELDAMKDRARRLFAERLCLERQILPLLQWLRRR